jgi:hypothetical protein
MNTAWGFIEKDYESRATIKKPTRVCSVCGANELGYTGSYYSKAEFWICPECIKKLKKLLDKENEE